MSDIPSTHTQTDQICVRLRSTNSIDKSRSTLATPSQELYSMLLLLRAFEKPRLCWQENLRNFEGRRFDGKLCLFNYSYNCFQQYFIKSILFFHEIALLSFNIVFSVHCCPVEQMVKTECINYRHMYPSSL